MLGAATGGELVAVACAAAGVAVGLVVVVVATKATHPKVSSNIAATITTATICRLKPNIFRGSRLYGGCCLKGLGAADGAVRTPHFAQNFASSELGVPQFRQ